MNISKRKQGILAIICTIAMIVTSITVYNPGEVKAADEASAGVEQPVMDGNPLIQYNKFNENDGYVIYVAGLDTIKNAKTYRLYVDGELWGEVTNGANIKVSNFKAGKHLFQVTGVNGDLESEKSKGYEITIPESSGGTTTEDVNQPIMNGNPLIQYNKFNESDGYVIYVAGLDTIKNAKTYRLYVDGELWGEVTNGANIKVSNFKAGKHLFQVTGVNGDLESEKSKGYEITIPESSGEATKYTVSIDGTEKQYEEGAKIAVPADGQGYYNVTKKEAYAPGTELTVNENMTLKSIALNVTMTKGASIRLAAPTGLRFQTTVKSGNGIAADEILNSKTVTTGTLITTLDLYTTHGKTLTKESASIYTVLDIANNGWFGEESNKETGKFCGSIINIQKENYGRKFIAVGYATINYLNGKSKTVYAEVTENNAKSIQYVAEKVQKSAAYDKYTHAQQGIIEKYIKGEEISK